MEVQVGKYAANLPAGLHPPAEPLPFLYLSDLEQRAALDDRP